MRTKTLLLTAVLGVAGIASSSAQGVFSVNSVGYVNQTFTKGGFYIIANPLNNGNNQISTVIPNAPDSTTVFRFNSTTGFGDPAVFVQGAGWFNSTGAATDVLAPGEAFFVQVPNTATFPLTITFVGDVPQGTSLSNPVTIKANKFNLIASQVPISVGLSTTGNGGMNFPAADGDTVYQFDGNAQAYKDPISFVQGAGWFNSTGAADPTPAVGEGFFLFSGSSTDRTWTRSFTVN
ncbi:MAG TPA: hypothetical protein VN887_13220 [Candidatus Angelobacter sp.]|nr:hypothetical protein [Candidatus Angelobacter sp.]